jgi:acetylserotonin N-methyltransferase
VLQSLSMLVCTEGKERTAAEDETPPKGVGFDTVELRRTGTPLDAVPATKELKRGPPYGAGSSDFGHP